MVSEDVDNLRKDIVDGTLDSWDAIHTRYNEIWQRYPEDKLRHAYLSLRFVLGAKRIGPDEWGQALAREIEIIRYIEKQVTASRAKDYENPFRKATFSSDEEMVAAYGHLNDNSFIRKVADEAPSNIRMIESLLAGD